MIRSRYTRWLLFSLLTLWLAVIAPGHERGSLVRTDGAKPGETKSCCRAPQQPQEGDCDAPPVDGAKCCAVCYLNATLDLPITIDLTPGYLGLVDRINLPRLVSLYAAPADLPYHGRAPPIFA